ncbi:DDE-type integrase/transposase/recombinase [Schleiferilactobacillus shenzhenensis]|uniref:DDE-type integrase/transposase/recombinase n=1 Tax=Schleiferilactobacillus shenzhenensis TaxID=1231337 RepID=UPI00068B5F57|nr:DDE-type integrase/transposase/recombinase [Schleiferilactobacillus shenzhenensis]
MKEKQDIVPIKVQNKRGGYHQPATTTKQKAINGRTVKLYFFACVLSHSRYKYVEWQAIPFRTRDLIRCLEDTFYYFGGRPKEIVFDQDRILMVSENSDDIIYTQEFESFKQAQHLTVVPCRGFDPESKGKIEMSSSSLRAALPTNVSTRTSIPGTQSVMPGWIDAVTVGSTLYRHDSSKNKQIISTLTCWRDGMICFSCMHGNPT